ncbi:bifunctional diaminohydroxyphosphoribosylaminopyrimidine deaminase/5-amino-6-(5-phosphoribosylamino)uracil reductase RibD [Nesterenkonia alba]|uniref:bifunctional diaminohydroxyphosphoribosylaminopyrimidine deaminase/5-amino-6-(5-phosphoribosylamino)uracil reductase RibD n=1 Tax=Nesterenkonia alba TaxID=515814 RepID=UPI0003B44F0C|nr:bifunctional diaminohydroxyphosphoribosylaminopyrimidine deaminase/5-amino-6-(5-phosphoribosylamino)uracil reductase RibD [Nesterenkonia alba]
MGPDPTDAALMRQALEAAHRGHRGANPLVGAIITDEDGNRLAIGHHRGAGSLHAERDAVDTARAHGITDFTGTTLYTTLEPCRTHGRQPPCTDLIRSTGIRRIVYGATDPTHNGGGGDQLREAGVDVVGGVLAEECRQLNHRWSHAAAENRPFVTVHLAQSLDARIAAADGTSQWITSQASRDHTHTIRRRVDAILVGTNTAVIDDPRLTARTPEGTPTDQQPLRCVMGLRELPPGATLTQGQPEGQGWLQLRTRDPLTALRQLAATRHNGHPIKHVLVEGGQSILSAFFHHRLVDEIFAYQAPLLLGAGRSALGDIGVTTLSQAHRFTLDPSDGGPVTLFDDDVCTHLAPAPAPAGTQRPGAH